jgi:hypothetical protein
MKNPTIKLDRLDFQDILRYKVNKFNHLFLNLVFLPQITKFLLQVIKRNRRVCESKFEAKRYKANASFRNT